MDQKKKAFILYTALNLNRRKGPYFEGTGTSVVQVPAVSGTPVTKFFPAYADGWGRMILYEQPTSGTRRKAKPLLTSKGAKVGESSDDLNNYQD